ncbi:MAG: hypothetical protein LBB45_05015 [Methanobrevibacter sp.]|jgi:hypothetical protein|nr:hypothetical protein [Candidatus Methanovirga basalitermitum]
MWLIKENVPNNHFHTLQELIDSVSNNEALEIFRHNPDFSFKEFCGNIYEAYIDFVKKEISTFKFFSVIVDDSVNICRKNQSCVFARFIDSKIKVQTLFLGIKEVCSGGATLSNLFKLLNEILTIYDMNIKNMVAFCSDGWCVKYERRNAWIKIINTSRRTTSCGLLLRFTSFEFGNSEIFTINKRNK